MPLKRLELYDFKSYRGKQVISFGDAPFVSVIGPNGAGKSNLMDAISFVLGVKSAQLRSTQLKDLIYRGRRAATREVGSETQTQTESGDDHSDARSAWVMAVYMDDAGKDWTFRRSVSMSGSSSYFLDGRSVAWKDYNAQLAKFNILVKAKNFLVFQGDVEGVASQDSKALARLIDRISGSLDLAPSYEAAKAAQEKATEASSMNYARKRSMLTEAKHFREQQEEIKQWERLNDSKDALTQRLILWRLYHLTNKISQSTQKVEEASGRLAEFRAASSEADSRLSDVKREQAKAQLNVKKREANLKKAEKAYEDKKPDLVAIDTQIAHSEKRASGAAAQEEKVKRDEKRQADTVKELEKGLEQITKNMEEAGERQRQRSQASGITLSEADLNEYRQLRASANLHAVQERQQLETLRREQKNLRDALASVEDQMQQAQRQREKLAGEVDGLGEREETDTYHKLLQAGADRRENERETRLKETLASLKRIFPGVHGRVVDLCRPVATKYDTAVMTVLGKNIDAVVVEHEKVAIDCIEYMRNQRAGQATFIPLDTIQVKPVPERLRNFARGARLAIDCIEYDPAVERAMQHACSSSLICDTMDIARYVCYERAQEVKAVTLDGTVIHKSGLITGGQGAGGGRKFDDKEVEGLNKLKETYLAQLQELYRSKPQDKGDEALLESLSRLDAESNIAKDDLHAIQVRLRGVREELSHAISTIERLTPDVEALSQSAASSEERSAALVEIIEQADDEVFSAFCQRIGVSNIREYEDVQLRIAKEANEAMESFAAQQARVKHQIDFESTQLRNTRERIAHLRDLATKAENSVNELRSQREEIQGELESLRAEIDRQRGKLNDANDVRDEVVRRVDEMRERSRKAQKTLDRAIKEIATWNDEISKYASDRHAIYRRCRLEEIDLPLIKGRLDKVPIEEPTKDEDGIMEDEKATQKPVEVDDYGLEPDFDILEEEDRANEDEEVGREFEAQISKMRNDLERLVPNMKAVERLDEVERELDDAEREAEETRKESKRAKDDFQAIKKKRCDLFNKAYNHMSEVIDKIYKDLTKSQNQVGGTAWFTLEEAEEPYLSGVNYSTMPPGKRFAEMEQLSGGEKTMAALALLFAIHSFHPAPFFVLDEVDAALDATNVQKLSRYIRSQADRNVQFLIISLKSTLYEKADGLVGVYREQEQNSSMTLTLDLRKYGN
ncbi:cohesin complex subunit psm1 [Cryptococcus deuterogattii 99/473]|uniref:Structural maintenance of chromosomes protein n=1 Tax=Cryptococcus deuterogattii Ram5 TaxID=1296110 RepID=A0A0D0TRL5_9TREE|nr:cohesin complex subunit psm1 [Cryptococcus deuterogattii Ram5]KIY55663.1 cohesin complex subunit psm1 [Cryptococcus deuterogattii 99/473]